MKFRRLIIRTLESWIGNLTVRAKRTRNARLVCEHLEERCTPAAFVVDTTADLIALDGKISLREAITAANTNAISGDAAAGQASPTVDAITFAPALFGQTILLTSNLPQITESLNIAGAGTTSAAIVIDGSGGFRPIDVTAGDTVNLSNLTLTNASQNTHGGAVNNSGTMTLTNVTISNSNAVGANIDGGAIFNATGADLTITNGVLINNVASRNGGAIKNSGKASIIDSRLEGNSALVGNGGAISDNGTLIINRSSIRGNRAVIGGGLDMNGTVSANIQNSTIAENFATQEAGGFRINGSGAILNVTNSTIAYNQADNGGIGGGGFSMGLATTTLLNVTLVRNSSTSTNVGSAGGINKVNGTLIVRNSIIAENSASPGGIDDNVDLADINTNEDNFIGGNARLGTLQDNGGPTFTLLPLAGSPVIDAGKNFHAAGLTADQRGLDRKVGTIDLGAVEFATPAPPIAGVSEAVSPTFVVNSLLDGAPAVDGKLTLREAITAANTNAASGDAGPGTTGLDVIVFDPSLLGGTITLTAGELGLTGGGDVKILGLGGVARGVSISGNGTSRAVNIAATAVATMSDLTITRGDAGAGAGGGIRNQGKLTLTNMILVDNEANDGGGLSTDSGTTTIISGSTISNNRADDFAAGIFNRGTLSIDTSTIAANTATQEAGGIGVISGTVNITRSTITGNTAITRGGGLHTEIGTLNVTNSTIAFNSSLGSSGGGGVKILSGTVSILNSTISGNSDTSNDAQGAGGISLSGGTLTLRNSIVSLNSAGPGSVNNDVDPADITTNTANLLGGDPRLGPLQNNGGPTFTMLPFANSPVINAGDNASAATIPFDQRGFSARTTGGQVDQGAVEVGATPPASPAATLVALGVGANANKLVRFDAASPNLVSTTVVTGLGASTLVGIDFRPRSGELIGLGVSGNTASLFRIDQGTGAATLIGSTTVNTIAGATAYGVDFNPVTDRLRVVNNLASDGAGGNANNFRLNPNNGALVAVDVDLDFTGLPGGNGDAPDVAVAYSNNIDGATATTLFGLVSGGDRLVIHGGAAPGFPTLQDVGLTHLDASNNAGFDIIGSTNTALSVMEVGGVSLLVSIDLTTGAATALGQVGDGSIDFGGITIVPDVQTILCDDFNRPNNANLGLPWVKQAGALGIVGNLAQGTGTATTVHVASVGGVNLADVNVSASVNVGVNQQAGLVARYVGTGDKNYYLGTLIRTATETTASLRLNNNGVVTELVSAIVAANAGELRLSISGGTLRLFLDNVLVASVVDATLTSGSVGIRTVGGASIDNFCAIAVNRTVPGTDTFTAPDNVIITDPWLNQVGAFRTLANKVQGFLPLNLATLIGVRGADVDLTANVTVTGLNHQAGLIARYSGPGDKNYYLGVVTKTATGFVAQIRKNVGGALTTLKSANLTSGTGALRFLVTGSFLQLYFNDVLVTSVIDTKFTTGGVGMRADAFATLDDYNAKLVTTALPFSDSFSLADNAPLNSNWTTRVGGAKVVANAARGTAIGTAANVATLVGVRLADIELQANVNVPATTGHAAGLIARYGGPGDTNYYEARISRTSTGFLASILKGTTTLQKVVVGTGAGTLKFSVFGATLKLSFNGALLLTATDLTIGPGGAGMRMAGTASIDNYTATALTVALPVNFNFNQGVNTALPSPWTSRVGNYLSSGTAAKGTTSLNVTTLAGVNIADVDVTANIALPAVGQFASLLARSSGPGDNNTYMATVTRTSTGVTAALVRKVNGVLTTLGSINLAGAANSLRFKLVGSQLQMFVNGVLQLTRFDLALTSGSVGIRSSKDTTFDDFAAT